MRLQDEIKAFNEKILSGIPQETINIIVQAAENLAVTGIVNQALSKGCLIPGVRLKNNTTLI